MKIAYQNTNKSIAELLDSATNGQTVIPTIQRPFVWSPNDIIQFIDSLLRGWPFGTMLFFIQGNEKTPLFPCRRFHTDFIEAAERDENGMDDYEYSDNAEYMVLDGQQRFQSLLIAFAGSYRASEKEWRASGYKTTDGNIKDEHVVKYLCYNLSCEEDGNESELQDDSVALPLNWKTEEEIHHASGLLVPLKTLFERPEDTDIFSPSDNIKLTWLKEQMMGMRNLPVPVLLIDGSVLSAQDKEDDVLEIFTRLNTQGTPLTREQIFAAQIKRLWTDFPHKLDQLRSLLSGKYGMGGYIDDDDLVTGFNLMLQTVTNRKNKKEAQVEFKTGKYGSWDNLWQRFSKLTILLMETLVNRFSIRYHQEYTSLHAIWFIVALLYATDYHDTDEEIDQDLAHEIVRWLMITGWAKIWANKSSDSVRIYTEHVLTAMHNHRTDALAELRDWLNNDEKLKTPARDNIENLNVISRGEVRKYYSALWVWMRMTEERALLLTSFEKDSPSWQVDHIIPAAWKQDDPKYAQTLNCLGNCWLLESLTNNNKDKMPFNDFLKEYDFPENNTVAKDIDALNLMSCRETSKDDEMDLVIVPAIKERGEKIKADLIRYISGDRSQLFYKIAEEQKTYNPKALDIYRGADFVKSPQFMKLKTSKSKSSYLSGIRHNLGKLTWSAEYGPSDGSTKEQVTEYIKQNYDELLGMSDGTHRSAWKMYLGFLGNVAASAGGKRQATKRKNAEPKDGNQRVKTMKQTTSKSDKPSGSEKAIRRLPKVLKDTESKVHKAIEKALKIGCTNEQWINSHSLMDTDISTIRSMYTERGNSYGKYFEKGEGVHQGEIRFTSEVWERLKELGWHRMNG